MDMTEEMVSEMVKEITGSYETVYHTMSGEEYKVNWARPWRRIDMMPALEEATGEKFPAADQLHTKESQDFLKATLKKMNLECSEPRTSARMLDKMVGEYIESKCRSMLSSTYELRLTSPGINPTMIVGHPGKISPPAHPLTLI
jgi:lysyl-tRNA synthetase class 2